MKKLIYLIVVIVAFGLIVAGCILVVPPTEQNESGVFPNKGIGDPGEIWNQTTNTQYSTIQIAITAASSDDIISVGAGTFSGFTDDKGLDIRGAQYNVDPAGNLSRGLETVITSPVKITADNASVNGFKMTSSSYIEISYASYSALDVNVSYNILVNTTWADGAVDLNGGNRCAGGYIGYNTIKGASGYGIQTIQNDDVTMEYNHVLNSSGFAAIDAGYHDGTGIVIHGNTITNSGGKGINYWAEDGGVINDNVITNSNYEAIFTDAQATISGNQISGGSMYGIFVYNGAAGSTVSGNNISNTNWEGIQSDVQVIITNNDISGGYNGIQLSNAASGSVIDGNNIHNNRFWGLSILSTVTDVTAKNNQLTDNPYCGVIVWGDGEGSGIHINCNNITGNGYYGVCSERTTSDVDATHNWWGHATGPLYSGNSGGIGDAVSDYVDYSNWAYIPDFCDCEAKTIGYWRNHSGYVEGILVELGVIEVGTGKTVNFDVAMEIFAKPKSTTYSMLAAQLLAAKLNVAQLSQFIMGYNSGCVSTEIGEADGILNLVNGYKYEDSVVKVDKDSIDIIKDVLDDFNNYGCEQLVLCPCIYY